MCPQIKLQPMLYNLSHMNSVEICVIDHKITYTMSGEQHNKLRNTFTEVSLQYIIAQTQI